MTEVIQYKRIGMGGLVQDVMETEKNGTFNLICMVILDVWFRSTALTTLRCLAITTFHRGFYVA